MAELIVALDYPELSLALNLVKSLQGRVAWFKIGLELFSSHGPEAVHEVQALGGNVFLDLKLMDIPNTVQAAVRTATRMGVGMLTVHLSGGKRMVQAALQGREEGLGTAGSPLILGVTLLTSLDREDIAWMGNPNPAELVLHMASSGRAWGVDGVVCSAVEVGQIKKRLGPSCVCVTPGIRIDAFTDDQARTSTPSAAVAAGADYLVVGRPITASKDPVKSADLFCATLHSALPGES
ncbi:MAG TPA: orotidine-5'-phosphate decarboxylase [Desulfonatronum sp.]|nr:orotidine-5'-phosphate decarboxylase [Desulfonatronum sp.]